MLRIDDKNLSLWIVVTFQIGILNYFSAKRKNLLPSLYYSCLQLGIRNKIFVSFLSTFNPKWEDVVSIHYSFITAHYHFHLLMIIYHSHLMELYIFFISIYVISHFSGWKYSNSDKSKTDMNKWLCVLIFLIIFTLPNYEIKLLRNKFISL